MLLPLLLAFLSSPADLPPPLEIREGLALPAASRGGRTPLPIDLIALQIARGEWKRPEAGATVDRPGGGEPLKWSSIKAGEDGTFQARELGGGYFLATVESPVEEVRILEAEGHAMVFVHGEPRAGDPYSNGATRLPVLLKKGANEFLFRGGRGRLKARLVSPKTEAILSPADPTLPDLVVGEVRTHWAALPVLNASTAPRAGLILESRIDDAPPVSTPVPALLPLSARKIPFQLAAPATEMPGVARLTLRLLDSDAENAPALDEITLDLRVRSPEQTRKRTFISSIDGSVQYYAHLPMRSPVQPTPGTRPALFLSLHGASVEAIGQADAYTPKDWGHLVAPTNRRPFGFDWEDWGRLDALEVLDIASRELGVDPDRTYLTGHSMGGHGTWHIGATFPDRFAAIAPSAGWVSMWSYGGARTRPDHEAITPAALLSRAASPSDTLALKQNYGMHGVYVLHGDADDNVPVDQARTMRTELGQFHPDFAYYERPGAGHWWGNECVDWAPLFDFLSLHRRPSNAETRRVEFTTANPGISSSARWARIEAQQRSLVPSRIDLTLSAETLTGKTENVARLCIDLTHFEALLPLQITLDGQPPFSYFPPPGPHIIHLARASDGTWSYSRSPSRDLKGPHRAGPFKDAFRNKMVFVHGTQGTPEETAWALARARYDAELFTYQGNGSIEVVADTAFDPAIEADRNVILYGNADTHEDWAALLADSPVQVKRGNVTVGDRVHAGDDLLCYFLRPRPGSDIACIAAISATGLPGFRASDRLPLFSSGIAYPDFLLASSSVLSSGADGLIAAGYFGPDWSIEAGEFAWSAEAP